MSRSLLIIILIVALGTFSYSATQFSAIITTGLLSFFSLLTHIYLYATSFKRKIKPYIAISAIINTIIALGVAYITLEYSQHLITKFSSIVIAFIVYVLMNITGIVTLLLFSKNKTALPTSTLVDKPLVSIIIPMRNEPFDVVLMTINSCLEQDYGIENIEIIVVDNSDIDNKDYLKTKAYIEAEQKKGININFIHRDGTDGFKARNLDIGIEATNGEYITLLDVDSTLKPDSITQAVMMLEDEKDISFVQFLLEATNRKANLLTQFYFVMHHLQVNRVNNCRGNIGFNFFQGHNAIWRKSAIVQTGSQVDLHKGQSIMTEDLALSIRAQLKGHYGKFITTESGEFLPYNLLEIEKLWTRWGYGTFQATMKYFFKILGSKNITYAQKLDAVVFMSTLPVVAYFPFSILMLLFVPFSDAAFFGLHMVFISVQMIMGGLAATKLKLFNKGILSLIKNLYMAFIVTGSFMFFALTKTFFRFMLGQKQGWKPTAKSVGDEASYAKSIKIFTVEIIYATVSILGVSYALHKAITSNQFIEAVIFSINGIFASGLLIAVLAFAKVSPKKEGNKNNLRN